MKTTNKRKVLLGMSGGIDSSVSALLLKEQGYEVIGLYMKNWDCKPEDYKDVVSICEQINIPYYTISFEEEYKNKVFNEFIKKLDQGYNINPDVLCNKYIKFDLLFNMAMKLGCDFLATGHYVQTDGLSLYSPKDINKDQTYFLYDIDYTILSKILFPLGNLLKSEVREIAQKNNFINSHKKDSMGICFIGNKGFKDFIKKYKSENEGNILLNDKILGKHKGLHFYTIGQRKGLSLSGGPYVVIDKDIDNNNLIIDYKNSSNSFFKECFIENKVGFFSGECFFRFTNLGKKYKGKINNNLLSLDTPIKKVGLGQSVVFYSLDNKVLGGGTIKSYKKRSK